MRRMLVCLACLLACPGVAMAGDTWSNPHPGIRRLHRTTTSPNQNINLLEVDLCAAGVSLRATASSERQQTVSSFGSSVGAQAAINGDFFSYTGYGTVGLSVGNGQAWSDTADNGYEGYLAFGTDRVELVIPSDVVPPAAWMKQVVSGRPQLVRDGAILSGFTDPDHCSTRHPRTVVGLSADRRTLYLVVVDGRTTAAAGMTCDELATLMHGLGAADVLNYDGGGSSTMWVSGLGVINVPSGGSQRVVANHLAVFASGSGAPGSCVEGREVAIAQAGTLDPGGTSDLDGDGKADVCARSAAGIECYLASGAGFPTAITGPALANADGWYLPSRYSTLRTGDVTGDGLADLCGRAADGFRCWPSTGAGFGDAIDGPTDLSDAAGFTELEYYSTITLADMNGDGLDDVCARSAAGFGCYPATGTGFGARIAGPELSDASGWAHLSNYGTLRMGDLDGDGKADVCARANATMLCWLSDGAGFPTQIAGPEWSDANGWDWPRYWSTIRLVDLDGDGRADVCARTAADFRCHLSNGAGFDAPIIGPALSEDNGWGAVGAYSTIRLGDLDADGDRDLCARSAAGVSCYLFEGDGFSPALTGPELSDATGWGEPEHYRTIRMADVSGDGRADLCARAGAGLWCWLSDGAGFPTLVSDGPPWSDASGWAVTIYADSIRMGPPLCAPGEEVCNGVDDDCDREVDEGCVADAGADAAAAGSDGGPDGRDGAPGMEGNGVTGTCGCRLGGTGIGGYAGGLLPLALGALLLARRRSSRPRRLRSRRR